MTMLHVCILVNRVTSPAAVIATPGLVAVPGAGFVALSVPRNKTVE